MITDNAIKYCVFWYRENYEKYCSRGCHYEDGADSDFGVFSTENLDDVAERIATELHSEPDADFRFIVTTCFEDMVASSCSYIDAVSGIGSIATFHWDSDEAPAALRHHKLIMKIRDKVEAILEEKEKKKKGRKLNCSDFVY